MPRRQPTEAERRALAAAGVKPKKARRKPVRKPGAPLSSLPVPGVDPLARVAAREAETPGAQTARAANGAAELAERAAKRAVLAAERAATKAANVIKAAKAAEEAATTTYLTSMQEAFARSIAAGRAQADAYIEAGFSAASKQAASNAGRNLLKIPAVVDLIEKLREERAAAQEEARRLAIERTAINMERVAIELGRIGFANMANYARVSEATGEPVIDFTGVTRETWAAVTSLQVTDKGVKFTLGDKRAALMDIAKLFGWIVEKRENRIVDEFADMTDEQIEAWLDERAASRMAIRQRALSRSQKAVRGRAIAQGGGIGSPVRAVSDDEAAE